MTLSLKVIFMLHGQAVPLISDHARFLNSLWLTKATLLHALSLGIPCTSLDQWSAISKQGGENLEASQCSELCGTEEHTGSVHAAV